MSRGSFLSRWSRLKQEAREKEVAPPPPPVAPPEPAEEDRAPPAATPDDAPSDDAQAGDAAERAAGAEAPPPDLPDIESLTRDSDYTGFLRKEVPKALQRQALRKLWRSDPVFANLDGLNDYDEDFSKPAIVGKAVKTSFDALRGYAPAEPEPVEQTAGTAEAPGQDHGETAAHAPAIDDAEGAAEVTNAGPAPEALEDTPRHAALPHEGIETEEPSKDSDTRG